MLSRNAHGRRLRAVEGEDGRGGRGRLGDEEGERPIEPKVGLNRLVWDMRILRPSLLPRAVIWGNSQGPKVSPGTYTVRVKYAGQTQPLASKLTSEVKS